MKVLVWSNWWIRDNLIFFKKNIFKVPINLHSHWHTANNLWIKSYYHPIGCAIQSYGKKKIKAIAMRANEQETRDVKWVKVKDIKHPF